MNSRKLALSVAATAFALYGCDGGGTTTPPGSVVFPERDFVCASGASAPCETTQPARTDAQRTATPGTALGGVTLTYVINTIALPVAAGGRAAGFNLDDLDSGEGSTAADANCEEYNPDFISLLDNGHVGVDNALQSLVPTIEGFLDAADCPGMNTTGCLSSTLQQQVNEGSVILLVEVTGVDDYNNDASIQMQLIRAEVPGGGAPTIEDGRIAAGQAFNVVERLGTAVPGDILNGRVRAATASLTLAISAGDFDIDLIISNPEIRFDISAAGLANGQIGGVITTADIIAAASAIMPGIEDTVRSVVNGIADVDPSAADPGICDALSVGITFGATTATHN